MLIKKEAISKTLPQSRFSKSGRNSELKPEVTELIRKGDEKSFFKNHSMNITVHVEEFGDPNEDADHEEGFPKYSKKEKPVETALIIVSVLFMGTVLIFCLHFFYSLHPDTLSSKNRFPIKEYSRDMIYVIPWMAEVSKYIILIPIGLLLHVLISRGLLQILPVLVLSKGVIIPKILFNVVLTVCMLGVVFKVLSLFTLFISFVNYFVFCHRIVNKKVNFIARVLNLVFNLGFLSFVTTPNWYFGPTEALLKRAFQFLPKDIHAILYPSEAILNLWGPMCRLVYVRQISFVLDYYEHVSNEKECVEERGKYYNLFWYFAYLLYFPTFFTGPISSFVQFVKQVIQYRENKVKLTQCTPKSTWKQLIVLVVNVCVVFLWLYLHPKVCYFRQYLLHPEKYWKIFTGPEFAFIFYYCSFILFWGKYFVVFNIARIWCLLDGFYVGSDINFIPFTLTSALEIIIRWHRTLFVFSMKYLMRSVPINILLNSMLVLFFGIIIHGYYLPLFVKYFLWYVGPAVLELILEYVLLRRLPFLRYVYYPIIASIIVPVHFTPYEIRPRDVLKKLFIEEDVFSACVLFGVIFTFFLAKFFVLKKVVGWKDSMELFTELKMKYFEGKKITEDENEEPIRFQVSEEEV